MERTNIFIVDDNKLMVSTLEKYLQGKFGDNVNITTFNDGESCLKQVTKDLHIVILDYFMKGKNGLQILQSIKATNPKTEVIMLSGNENMALAIESFRAGAKDYVVKDGDSWNRITKVLNHIITKPIRFIVKGFNSSK